jgi:hypothetical protein
MSLFVNGLAILGIIFILVLVIVIIVRIVKYQNKQTILSLQRPTPDYMQNIGMKCPDYWYLNNTDSNYYYCTKTNDNNYKVPAKSLNPNCSKISCTDSTGIAKFTVLPSSQKWVTMSDSDKKSFVNKSDSSAISRCNWIKCCGQNKKSAVWLGIANQCN